MVWTIASVILLNSRSSRRSCSSACLRSSISVLVPYHLITSPVSSRSGSTRMRNQRNTPSCRRRTSKTLERFQAYHWPGNIRELQNVVERAVILCDGETFSVDESWFAQQSAPASGPVVPFVPSLVEHERQMIEAALAGTRGVVAGAARKLGIPRQTLDARILSLGIDKLRFKTR